MPDAIMSRLASLSCPVISKLLGGDNQSGGIILDCSFFSHYPSDALRDGMAPFGRFESAFCFMVSTLSLSSSAFFPAAAKDIRDLFAVAEGCAVILQGNRSGDYHSGCYSTEHQFKYRFHFLLSPLPAPRI